MSALTGQAGREGSGSLLLRTAVNVIIVRGMSIILLPFSSFQLVLNYAGLEDSCKDL
jgi:hypothetical protein